MRIVDLFCGIGGVAAAARSLRHGAGAAPIEVSAAIDIDRRVQRVYEANHGVTPHCVTLESFRAIPQADLWWLSPPCQPYTRRGRGLAERDPRSAALEHLIGLIDRDRPEMVVLENVPAFVGSAHHKRLTEIFLSGGYTMRENVLCPTQWGVPMRRRRFYLQARRGRGQIQDVNFVPKPRQISKFVDPSACNDLSLRVSQQLVDRFGEAMHLIDPRDPIAVAACFTSAYAKSPVRAGSYLRCGDGNQVRLFSPGEISGLLGFSEPMNWPQGLSQRDRYHLLGNSLAVNVVRILLQGLLDR